MCRCCLCTWTLPSEWAKILTCPSARGISIRSEFTNCRHTQLRILCMSLATLSISYSFLYSSLVPKITSSIGIKNHLETTTNPDTVSIRAWAIIIAISCLGSLNSIIYTFSRGTDPLPSPPPQAGPTALADLCHRPKVKQAIGQANILPWSNVWKKSHTLSKGKREDDIKYKSPQGGLIAHWLMSVVFIAAGSGIHSLTESIILPGYFQTYAHAFILCEYKPAASPSNTLAPDHTPNLKER